MKCVVAGYGSRGDVEPCIAVASMTKAAESVTSAADLLEEAGRH